MVGERLRNVRVSQGLSLSDVAHDAKISAATLSRIETGKQPIDVPLLLLLATILKAVPSHLLDTSEESGRWFADGVASLTHGDRLQFWEDLSGNENRAIMRVGRSGDVAQAIDEILAQIDALRDEVVRIRTALGQAKSPRK